MGNLFGVEVFQGQKKLLHNKGCSFLGKIFLLDYVMEQLASLAKFKNQKANIVPFPDLVELDYVWMILEFYNLDFEFWYLPGLEEF